MDNEAKVIAAVKNGDETAFKQLYNNYAHRVFNTALSIMQHHEEAEDITQEVFVQVFRSIVQFKVESSLFTWIYKITVSKCADAQKKHRSQKRFAFITSLFASDDSLKHDTPHFEHPGIAIEHKEHNKALFTALKKLATKQQIAFTLNKIEGLSYQQTAEAMNTSTAAVESLLFRANENLRSLLSSYYKNNVQHSASSLMSFLLML